MYQEVSVFDLILARINGTHQLNDTCGIYKVGILESLLPPALLSDAIKFISSTRYLDQKDCSCSVYKLCRSAGVRTSGIFQKLLKCQRCR